MSSLSVAMIVGKEEDRLLELSIRQSLRVADEVVVVASDEDSYEIAKSQGARAIFRRWMNDHALTRNVSLGLCECEWIAVVDADELLCDKFVDDWPDFIGEADAYAIPTHNYVRKPGEPVMVRLGLDSDAPWFPDWHTRILKNTPDIFYAGQLHEQPFGFKSCKDLLDYPLEHFGWARDISILERRIAARNEQEQAAGGPGTHTLEEPWSDRETITWDLPELFDESYLELRHETVA